MAELPVPQGVVGFYCPRWKQKRVASWRHGCSESNCGGDVRNGARRMRTGKSNPFDFSTTSPEASRVLQEWAELGVGAAILPRSKLAAGVGADILIQKGSNERVTIEYAVSWHGE